MSAASLISPQSLNMYSYCGNDPINHTDPSGLFFGKLFKAIFKFLTNKWFVLAATVALTVITVGAGLGLWSLTGTVVKVGTVGGYTIKYSVAVTTTLGWVAAGLGTALVIPNLTGVSGIFRTALNGALGQASSAFGQGVGAINTPDWNPEVRNLQQGRNVRRSGRGIRGGYTGPGSWAWGTGRNRLPRQRKRDPDPIFPNLRDHFQRHAAEANARGYYAAALNHTRNAAVRQKVRHEGQDKWAYFTRTGGDSFTFTSTSLNGKVIFTHMRVDGQYLRNKGIEVRSYPPNFVGPIGNGRH